MNEAYVGGTGGGLRFVSGMVNIPAGSSVPVEIELGFRPRFIGVSLVGSMSPTPSSYPSWGFGGDYATAYYESDMYSAFRAEATERGLSVRPSYGSFGRDGFNLYYFVWG